MTITFVSSQEDTYSSATPLASRTVNVATGSRTHGVLIVKVNVINFQTTGDVTGVTWNGQALTQAVESGDSFPFADIWYLTEFGGGTHDVVVSFDGNGVTTGATVFQVVVEWYDSDAEISGTLVDTDIDTANEDPTTVTVTNAAGDLIASTYVTADNNVAAVSNLTLTQDWDQGGNCAGAGYLIADGANETVGWDRDASGQSAVFIHVVAVFEETAGGDTELVVSAVTHAHAADNVALIQAHVLAAADSTHGHASDNVALLQAYTLAVDNAEHGHTAANVTLDTGSTVLDVADAEHGHTAESPALTQAYTLTVQDAAHAHDAANVELLTGTLLVVADAAHAHAAEAPALIQQFVLTADDATHSHTAEVLALIQQSVLTVAGAEHAHTAESVTVTFMGPFTGTKALTTLTAAVARTTHEWSARLTAERASVVLTSDES